MLSATKLADALVGDYEPYTVGVCAAPLNIANAIAMDNLAARAIWDLSHRPQPDSMGGLGITRARPHL